MIAVDIQYVLLSLMNLSQPLDVEGWAGVINLLAIYTVQSDEGGQEVAQLLRYI